MDGLTRKNILVIVADTFRRDNLAVYGGIDSIAPNLNRFAKGSSVFDRFYSCSFPTVPARADLLTGRVAFTRQGWGPLNPGWATIAELARDAGYDSMEVTDVPFLVQSGYGYDRGFEDYLWVRGQTNQDHPKAYGDASGLWKQESDHFAPTTMRSAAEWLERRQGRSGRPFLLVADTWDPHEPWDAPSHYVRKFWPEYEGQPVPYPPYAEVGPSDGDRDYVALGRAAYLGKVNMVDFWIGYLLDRLDALGLAEDTVVFFLTDHGFYFGEHNYFGKSIGWRIGPVSEHRSAVGEMGPSPLYEEVNHIPLLVRVPGWHGRRVSGLAAIPDVGATILSIMGASGCSESRSLIDGATGEAAGWREFTVTSWPMHLPGDSTQAVDAGRRRFSGFMPITVTTAEWALLYSDNNGPVELYDLRRDPAQTSNVAGDHREVVVALHARLLEFLREAECPEPYLSPRLKVADFV